MVEGLRRKVEEAAGLPPLEEILGRLPDEGRLKLYNSILEKLLKLQGRGEPSPELLKYLAGVTPEQLEVANQLLDRVLKALRMVQRFQKTLPLEELLRELIKEVKR